MFPNPRLSRPALAGLLAAAALAPAAALAAQPAPLRSPQGYAVTLPAGWQMRHGTVTHTSGPGTDLMYAHPPGRLPVFRIEVDPQQGATMADAPALQAAFVRTQVAGARVLEQRRRPLAGSPASETMASAPFQGRPVLMDMIFTIHNGRCYTVTLMTTPQTAVADLKTFGGILSTLRWSRPQ